MIRIPTHYVTACYTGTLRQSETVYVGKNEYVNDLSLARSFYNFSIRLDVMDTKGEQWTRL